MEGRGKMTEGRSQGGFRTFNLTSFKRANQSLGAKYCSPEKNRKKNEEGRKKIV